MERPPGKGSGVQRAFVAPGPILAALQPQANPIDHVQRARVLAEQDKHEEAISCFEAAIAIMTISGSDNRNDTRSPDTQAPSTPPPSAPSDSEDMVKAMVGKGISLGKLGRSDAAAQAFDATLELDGDNVEALTYLGALRVQARRTDEGLGLYRRALELDPTNKLASEGLATALTDEGTRLKLLGQTDDAMLKYTEAVRACPEYAPAHYNEGIVLAERGLVQQALDAYARALKLWPGYAEAHNNRGVLLKGLERLPEAIEAYRACLDINPNFELAAHNLSLALSDLGTAVKAQGQIEESIRLYQQALSYNATSADAMYNLGVAYVENNEPLKASVCYQLTTELNPRSAEAFNNLGVIYKDMENLPRALSCYEAALRIRPTFPEALNNMGVVFTIMNQPEDALPYFNSALQVAPSYAEAYTNLGKLFQDAGDADKAIQYYERCLSLCPYSDNAAHNRLLALNYSLRHSRDSITAAHSSWGKTFRARALSAAANANSCVSEPFGNTRCLVRQLRVGYLSPDFNKHSVSYFTEALLRHHSATHFHVTCYSASSKEDATTRRLRSLADSWVSVAGLPPLLVAHRIRSDQIDILVELAGHTAGNRLDVLALRPAPVQVTWIGYPNTTGLDTVQYRFTDQLVDPLDTTQHFTEELVRLPETFLCYTPPEESEAGPVSPPPSSALGYVTFGSFNNVAKINGRVVRLWARILLALPDSRLLLKSRAFAAKQVKESCLCAFSQFSVDRSRIDLLQVLPQTRDHLSKYSRMDISLDTFPYAGTTTTVEALLMGVPVVTLRATGQDGTHAQNVGVSLLTQVGCTELIASSEDQFVEIAVNLARSPERMRALRETLRQRLLASPLCDGARYMVHVENKYRCMWRRFCAKEPEQHGETSEAAAERCSSERTDDKDTAVHQGAQHKLASEMDREGGEEGAGAMEGEGIDGVMEGEGQGPEGDMEREIVKMEREAGDGEAEPGGDATDATNSARREVGREEVGLVEGDNRGADRRQGYGGGGGERGLSDCGDGDGEREAALEPFDGASNVDRGSESQQGDEGEGEVVQRGTLVEGGAHEGEREEEGERESGGAMGEQVDSSSAREDPPLLSLLNEIPLRKPAGHSANAPGDAGGGDASA